MLGSTPRIERFLAGWRLQNVDAGRRIALLHKPDTTACHGSAGFGKHVCLRQERMRYTVSKKRDHRSRALRVVLVLRFDADLSQELLRRCPLYRAGLGDQR